MRQDHCFEVYGIELEYMVVSRDTLQATPVVDRIFMHLNNRPEGEFVNGKISWSNELVAHVIELKTTKPVALPSEVLPEFRKNVEKINSILSENHCCLLPTACHPFMDPLTETRIWPHDAHEIYELYNRIFDCRGHGWSNVQSTHLNLPFQDDDEFDRLHTAIRLLLPIIPALCASSPILEGKQSGWMDSRMFHYQYNQQTIPVIGGKVIPEYIRNQEEYRSRIFTPINTALKPYDTDHILEDHFVNSRGAIARFDRGSIEIRVMDIQECPEADVAILELVIEVLKSLVFEEWSDYPCQASWQEDDLYAIFQKAIHRAEMGQIDLTNFGKVFGIGDDSNVSLKDLWTRLYDKVKFRLGERSQIAIELILEQGSLATRIIKNLNGSCTYDQIHATYQKLADCLESGKMFVPGN